MEVVTDNELAIFLLLVNWDASENPSKYHKIGAEIEKPSNLLKMDGDSCSSDLSHGNTFEPIRTSYPESLVEDGSNQ